jgi:hypothetical protein
VIGAEHWQRAKRFQYALNARGVATLPIAERHPRGWFARPYLEISAPGRGFIHVHARSIDCCLTGFVNAVFRDDDAQALRLIAQGGPRRSV